jgi:endonuclease YncB( thermonuclease family)
VSFPQKRRRPRRSWRVGDSAAKASSLALIIVAAIAIAAVDALQVDLEGLVSAASPPAAPLTGRASVVDGDTLTIRDLRIRLHGVDAPERGQLCRDPTGADYRCGQKAALALSDRIGQQPVACEARDVDRYDRVVAVCFAGGTELNHWLVREGWAVAYARYSKDYVPAETEARAAQRGIWSGSFTPPEDWRRGNR